MTKRLQKNQTSNRSKLSYSDRENWDICIPGSPKTQEYQGCSDAQLLDCYEYEFSRTVWQQGEAMSAIIQGDERLTRFYSLFKDYFPLMPWLKIPEPIRTRNLELLSREFPEPAKIFRVSSEVLELSDDPLCGLDVIGVGRNGLNHVTVLPLAISWHYTNRELTKAFSQWLQNYQPKATGKCKIRQPGWSAPCYRTGLNVSRR